MNYIQVSFKNMAGHIVTVSSPTTATDASGTQAERSLGLRGEERFLVVDSTAGPREPPLQCQFPFSFYMCRLLEALRKPTVYTGGEVSAMDAGKEDSLEREFALLGLGDRVHATLSREGMTGTGVLHDDAIGGYYRGSGEVDDEELIQRYAYDFTCMLLPSVQCMCRTDQARYVLMVLDLTGPGGAGTIHANNHSQERLQHMPHLDAEFHTAGTQPEWTPTTSLAALHHRFWRAEHAVQLHFKLIDAAGPTSVAAVLSAVDSRLRDAIRHDSSSCGGRTGWLDADLHIVVVRAVQNALLSPDSLKQRTVEGNSELLGEDSPIAWASKVHAAERAARDLVVAFVGESKGSEVARQRQRALAELEDGWAKLRLMRGLAVDVFDALPLSKQAAIGGLETLREMEAPVWSDSWLLGVVLTLSWVAVQLDTSVVAGSTTTTPDYYWDVLPRYLEQYLSEVLGSVGSRGTESDGVLTEPGEDRGDRLWTSLVALLSGDTKHFVHNSEQSEEASLLVARVLPREAACVGALRRLGVAGRGGNNEKAQFIRNGLLQSCKRAGGSFDNKFAACYVAVVEDDTTVDEVRSHRVTITALLVSVITCT